jgi:hypothetical protein
MNWNFLQSRPRSPATSIAHFDIGVIPVDAIFVGCNVYCRWFPQGIKRERGARASARYAVAAPATIGGECPDIKATGKFPGKVAGHCDPRARRSATGNGHARAHRAGCFDVTITTGAILPQGRRQTKPGVAVTDGRSPSGPRSDFHYGSLSLHAFCVSHALRMRSAGVYRAVRFL